MPISPCDFCPISNQLATHMQMCNVYICRAVPTVDAADVDLPTPGIKKKSSTVCGPSEYSGLEWGDDGRVWVIAPTDDTWPCQMKLSGEKASVGISYYCIAGCLNLNSIQLHTRFLVNSHCKNSAVFIKCYILSIYSHNYIITIKADRPLSRKCADRSYGK